MATSIPVSAPEGTDIPVVRTSGKLQRFLANRAGVVALVVLGTIVALAILAGVLAPHPPDEQNLSILKQGPTTAHWLGTDVYGRDILSRLLYASRVSLLAATQAVSIAIVLGIPIGMLTGYLGGWLDAIVSRIADALLSIPSLVLAFAIVGIRGPGLFNAMLAIGVILAPTFYRVSRATASDLRHETFILSSRSLGCSVPRILIRHLIPNASGPLLVQISFAASAAVVAEAALSFLGLGVQTPKASWGSMVAEGFKQIDDPIWPTIPPTVMIMTVVLSLFFLGDALRDATARQARHTL